MAATLSGAVIRFKAMPGVPGRAWRIVMAASMAHALDSIFHAMCTGSRADITTVTDERGYTRTVAHVLRLD